MYVIIAMAKAREIGSYNSYKDKFILADSENVLIIGRHLVV